MRKGILYIVWILTLISITTLVTASTITLTCDWYETSAESNTYQETADDINPAYVWNNEANIYDGNWSTFGTHVSTDVILYVNYTKFSGSNSNSVWQVKDSSGYPSVTRRNITIPDSCWDAESTQIQFQVGNACPSNNFYYYCKNSTGWQRINSTPCTGGTDYFYEEAMWFYAPASGSCPATTDEYLRLNNQSAEYGNAHAYLTSSSDNYTASLCCNSSDATFLNSTNPITREHVIVRLSSESNAHIEQPNLNNYNFTANFTTGQAGVVTCGYREVVCSTDEECMYSMASSGTNNQTNSHIAPCGVYINRVCCSATFNESTGGTADIPSGGGGLPQIPDSPNLESEDFVSGQCDYGKIYYEGECYNPSDLNCEFGFTKPRYDINESVVFEFFCPDYTGLQYSIQWIDGDEALILAREDGYISVTGNNATFDYDKELEGVLYLRFANDMSSYHRFRIDEKGIQVDDIKYSLEKGGVYIVLFLVLIIVGVIMFRVKKKMDKRRRKYQE